MVMEEREDNVAKEHPEKFPKMIFPFA